MRAQALPAAVQGWLSVLQGQHQAAGTRRTQENAVASGLPGILACGQKHGRHNTGGHGEAPGVAQAPLHVGEQERAGGRAPTPHSPGSPALEAGQGQELN